MGAEVELAAGEPVDALGDRVAALAELRAERREVLGVDGDAGELHLAEHPGEGEVDLEQVPEVPFFDQAPAQHRPHLGHRVGGEAGPGHQGVELDLGERLFLAAPAPHLAVGGQGTFQVLLGDLPEVVRDHPGGLDQERLEEHVAGQHFDGEAGAPQGDPQELAVVGDLGPLAIEQPGAEAIEPRLAEPSVTEDRHQPGVSGSVQKTRAASRP